MYSSMCVATMVEIFMDNSRGAPSVSGLRYAPVAKETMNLYVQRNCCCRSTTACTYMLFPARVHRDYGKLCKIYMMTKLEHSTTKYSRSYLIRSSQDYLSSAGLLSKRTTNLLFFDIAAPTALKKVLKPCVCIFVT